MTNLTWMKDGEEVSQVNVGDMVVLTAGVKDIDRYIIYFFIFSFLF